METTQKADDNTSCRGWILTHKLLAITPGLKELFDDYKIVVWTDLVERVEEFSNKIHVVVLSPLCIIPVTEDLLRKLPNVRAVVSIGIGVDHLDLALLRRRDIKVGVTLGAVTESTADMGFGLLMAAGRRIPEQMDLARGYEDGASLDPIKNKLSMGLDIHEATLGIVGMGRIGFAVARRAKGFRMNILYHNRSRRSREDEEEVNATYCSTLEELLPRADFLMISAPLTESTKNMMRKERFKLMKPTSILINIARGPLVNTDDLVDALRNWTITGAAVDVTDPEPLPDHHPLLHLPNAIVTPHVGPFTPLGTRRLFGETVANARAAMEGRRMPGELV